VRSLFLSLFASAALLACGQQPPTSGKTSVKPAPKAQAKLGARKCPDPDLIDPKDPCSIAYLAPYKPSSKRDKF
jgi:hypothetical protein